MSDDVTKKEIIFFFFYNPKIIVMKPNKSTSKLPPLLQQANAVRFLGRFLPANGNHSLHGKFKDLDLGRVFHYSECCMEKCLCPIQGLRTMEWVLWRELNEAWGSGGFTPAVHPVLFKVFRLVTLYLRVLSFLLYFSLHPLQMFWSTLLLLFFVFAFLTFYQIKLAGQFRNPLLGCHHMRAGM